MNWYMLIPIVVGIICAIFGYLIGRLSRGNNEDDTFSYKKIISKLESDLAACKANKSYLNNSVLSEASFVPVFDAAAAKAVFGKKIVQDDLTIVEGIGPKIAELFIENNVKTWKDLADTSIDKCKEILDSGGDRFKIHTPRTWPKQAKFAHEGKWEVLFKWQGELDGGK
ncbi:hypothetical protein [uncultured Polaribacter sp.]|uniref:hypothetical protein n=1 Tax=uncultured Polaribacter sp. TaxID=174711 RepID=UPI00262E3F0A|nr:hypothetical protein [uncultured Polaribacter sp.]